MFRLIKLAMYALVGYVLYELYQGMTQQTDSFSSSGGRKSARSFGGDLRSGALTGLAGGKTDITTDADGGQMRHTVGRGVVSR